MSKLMANDFSYFEMSVEEYRIGLILTAQQIQVIQNRLSMAVQEKLNIEDDPQNSALSQLQRAQLSGEINAYRLIILESNQAVQETFDEQKAQAELEKQQDLAKNSYQMFEKAKAESQARTTKSPL